MENPLVVFRTGYMEKYEGPDEIVHGGNWVEEHKRGGEMWNFREEAGRVYGFVRTRDENGLNLKRVAPRTKKWRKGDECDGVDIVFIARKPEGGQVVVGWYLDAKVYHRQYGKRPNPVRKEKTASLPYLCEADAGSATLLDEKQRTFKIPYAPSDGYGPGQSNVWYADRKDQKTKLLARRLRSYISGRRKRAVGGQLAKANLRPSKGWGNPLPKEAILAIEKASMEATEKHFKKSYRIEVVARDNRGWDMTAVHKKNGTCLHLEVKGHLGSVIQFELTPNEYRKMQKMQNTYRICVVRNALQQSDVEVFLPQRLSNGLWALRDKNNGTKILLDERTAARATQIL